MPTKQAQAKRPIGQSWLIKLPLAAFNLLLAVLALWLGMSIPSYFRSVSPLVLDAAAENTPALKDLAEEQLSSGRPGLAMPLLRLAGSGDAAYRPELDRLYEQHPLYRWSGGPAPYYEQFLAQAAFLREDETALIPTLLPAQHRQQMQAFLEQSPNRNVQILLQTRELSDWQRFYPVYSTSGQPLEATILATALLEQAGSIPNTVKHKLIDAAVAAEEGDLARMADLESIYLAVLTLGRYTNWLQMQTLMEACDSLENLLFTAQAIQQEPTRANVLFATTFSGADMDTVSTYLHLHGDRGWASLRTALDKGTGAVTALLQFDKPVYLPPAFWEKLPPQVHAGQQKLKAFAENYPNGAIVARVLAFSLCGVFLVGILRVLVLGLYARGGNERRLLINLDSLVGSVLVTLLVWVLIEPGLLDFRPNELGSLQLNLAQALPDDSLSTLENATSTMLDQVTILVLLLFFVAQLLVFIFGLLKITEIKRQKLAPPTKLRLLENEELLFDLGLYVGLGGTVASLILVVLNVVDASLMAAYASTLFGIIFVAILKIGFLRPFKRQLILSTQ